MHKKRKQEEGNLLIPIGLKIKILFHVCFSSCLFVPFCGYFPLFVAFPSPLQAPQLPPTRGTTASEGASATGEPAAGESTATP